MKSLLTVTLVDFWQTTQQHYHSLCAVLIPSTHTSFIAIWKKASIQHLAKDEDGQAYVLPAVQLSGDKKVGNASEIWWTVALLVV